MIQLLRRWAPKYDEITTYLTAASSILTLAFYPELRDTYLRAWSSWRERNVILVLVGGTAFCILGMAACIGSVLTRKENDSNRRMLMGMFTMGACGVAGIVATVENLPQEVGLSWTFPILNILAGVLLLYQMMLLPEDSVTNRQATVLETLASSTALVAVFAACHWYFALGWGMTYSVCLAFSCFAGTVAGRLPQTGVEG
jgi:hypothetical protein